MKLAAAIKPKKKSVNYTENISHQKHIHRLSFHHIIIHKINNQSEVAYQFVPEKKPYVYVCPMYMINIYFIEYMCENKYMYEYIYIYIFMCSTAAASAFAATIKCWQVGGPKADKFNAPRFVCVCVL